MDGEVINIKDKNKKFQLSQNKYAKEFLKVALKEKISIKEFNEAFDKLLDNTDKKNNYSYVGGNENNSSNIEVSSDPGRSIMERITNGIDSVLERLFEEQLGQHKDNPPSTPHKAAEKWLGIIESQGLKSLSNSRRMEIAKDSLRLKIHDGDGPTDRIIDVYDQGTGIDQKDFKDTILSISGTNKIRKKYVMGQYGQGGSSTFNYSKKTLIVSKTKDSDHLSFTVVWYEQPQADDDVLKVGNYRYLTENNLPLAISSSDIQLTAGTKIRHIGYDSSKYKDKIGTMSIYGLTQRILFNPPIPFLIQYPEGWGNRSMIGARSALLGATDENDTRTKIKVDYNQSRTCIPISDGQYGVIWVEYWLAAKPKRVKDKNNKWVTTENPVNSLIDKTKSIIFTNNGQNQFEESSSKVGSEMNLPFLKGRLIIHVDCNELKANAKRAFFSSTREQLKETSIKREILREIIEFVKGDDQLRILNEEAAKEDAKNANLQNKEHLKKEVVKFLNLRSGDLKAIAGVKSSGSSSGNTVGTKNPSPKPKIIMKEIKLSDPPTFLNILWEDDKDINFYKGRDRWIRVETDAHNYHFKKIKISLNDEKDLEVKSTTELNDGRFRFQVKCKDSSMLDNTGIIKVELIDEDLNINLSDKRNYKIVEVPQPKQNKNTESSIPDFDIIEVNGKNDEHTPWNTLFENEDDATKYGENDVSFRFLYNNGKIYVWYNSQFSNYIQSSREAQNKGGANKADLLRGRYETYLCGLAYIYHNERENNKYNKKNSENIQEDDFNIRDKSRIHHNSAAGSSLLLINQELFRRGASE